MNAEPFIELEAEAAADGVPVDVARQRMAAAIDLFIEQALEFHTRPAPKPGAIDLNPVQEPHAAFKITTGTGKSQQKRQGAAKFVLEQKRRQQLRRRVMFLVPTHRLADEASSKMMSVFGDLGISCAIYQSREAKDLKTGEPLCQNLDAVKTAQSIGADVQKVCCKKGKVKCRFFDSCAFQKQQEAAMFADVLFAAHEMMFSSLNRFGKDSFGLVIIDEAFSLKGIVLDPRQTRMKLDQLSDRDLTNHPVRKKGRDVSLEDTKELREISTKLYSALAQMPDGRLTKKAMTEGGATNITYGQAAKLEFKRMIKVQLRPDTPAEERAKLVEQYRYMRQVRRRARMWKALEEFMNGTEEIAGRLFLETITENGATTRYLRVLGKKSIHKTYTALPLLHGDATMEIELVRHHLPYITMLLDLEVLAPHEHTTQIVGVSVGKKILALPDETKGPEAFARQQARRDRLRALVIRLGRGRRTLVVCQKHVEDVFEDIPNVNAAHYGAIEGLDRYGNVEVLITIGRPMPSPFAIQMSGSALMDKAVIVGRRVKQERSVRFKDGTERTLTCTGYENEEANLLARAIAEGGVLQALGRSRAVNRTAQNPVNAFVILDDMTLPVPIDSLVHVSEIEPNAIDDMMTRGVVLEWPTDAARLFPDLFKDRKAAEYRYRRDGRVPAMFAEAVYRRNRRASAAGAYSENRFASAGGEPNNTIDNYLYSEFWLTSLLCRFKPTGRGQRERRALLSPTMVTNAEALIESALGGLAAFELITGELDSGPTDSRGSGRADRQTQS